MMKRYEWVDKDGEVHLTDDYPNSCETSLPVKVVYPNFPKKIERTCPRCGHHSYQWLAGNGTESAIKNTKLHTATCVSCGHSWPCRVFKRDI